MKLRVEQPPEGYNLNNPQISHVFRHGLASKQQQHDILKSKTWQKVKR